MSHPEVSVVLPVKNGGSYLGEAVESILEQSLQSIELILIDDSSADQAITGLDCSDPRLTVLPSPGAGVVDAFNHGMSVARGQFIARMDADDISSSERLETQLNFLHQNPHIDIAGACVELFADFELEGGNIHYQNWLNSVCTPEQISKQLFVESPIPNPSAFFRAGALERLGGYRDVAWPEDYDLFLRAGQMGMMMGKPDGILLKWREHANRLTRTSERYSKTMFQTAKAYFLANERLTDNRFIIWGAGPTGRQFYDLLDGYGREAAGFIEIHPRRIGGLKRARPVWDMHRPQDWAEGFILVAVGAKAAKPKISAFLTGIGKKEGQDFLFVA